MVEFLVWYLLISFIGWLALPIVFRFFPFLSDRGYTLARSAGLLLWGFSFWLLTSLHILQNDIGGVLIALFLLGALSFGASNGVHGWREMLTWLKGRVRLVVIAEILFLVSFAFLTVMRAAAPQIATTEKPMELAFINAILRSPTFPPADPWLSGYSISYYYFGYVLVAMLARVTGVVSGVAFNLGISLIFGLTALGSYGVVYNLLSSWSYRRRAEGKSGIFSQGWALMAPLFILIISNLEGGFELAHAGGLFWQDDGQTKKSEVWNWIGLLELNQPPNEPYTWDPTHRAGWWWWRASRVIQDYNMSTDVRQAIPGVPFSSYIASNPEKSGPIEVIDEFPFFSYYLGDLHPHVLSMPFVMLAIALALNLYLRGAQEQFNGPGIIKWTRQAEFWLTAMVLGSLAFFNTWDFPIYIALYSAIYTLVRFQQLGWQWRARIKDFVLRGITLGIAGILLYVPFYIGFSSQAGGILPSLAFFSRGLHFWIMFGVLLMPILFWLLWLGRKQRGRYEFRLGLRFAALVVGGLWIGSYVLGLIGLNLSAFGSVGQPGLAGNLANWGSMFINLQGGSVGEIFWGSIVRRLEMPGTWLTLLFFLAGTWALLTSFRPESDLVVTEDESVDLLKINPELGNPNGFVLVLVLVGIGLTLVPEFVYLRDQFGWRMNTIFKFYFQTWMLWGLAGSFAFVLIWQELNGNLARLGRFLISVFCLVALIYPGFAIAERLNFEYVQNWTLDGTAYISPDEKAAMDWLTKAPYGVIAEAIGGQYDPTVARMATQSGLPNVLGWPGHESQWRGGEKEKGSRLEDISQLYRTRDWNEAKAILTRYQIRYVIVGGIEQSIYRADTQKGLRGLDEQKFQKNLKIAYQNNSVTIYEMTVPSQ
jgi:uncharacterized membrane protein